VCSGEASRHDGDGIRGCRFRALSRSRKFCSAWRTRVDRDLIAGARLLDGRD
jgi:hypothetical protein